MDKILRIKDMLRLTNSQCADLFGVSYSEMCNIIEGKISISNKILKTCNILEEIFLNQLNTQCVKTHRIGDETE